VLAAGCAGAAAPRTPPDPFGHESGGQVFIEVRNEMEEDVLVRLRSGSIQRDLGSVPPRTVTRMTFPWSDFGRVTFQLEPASGSRYSLPAAEVRPGDSLELTIQNPISRSQLRR
jgi:hypothetical protein